jgi:hypothetical protein
MTWAALYSATQHMASRGANYVLLRMLVNGFVSMFRYGTTCMVEVYSGAI